MEHAPTVGQRFSELISHLGISKNAFANSLDKTATVIQHIVDERNKPGFDLLCKVFEVYPNVSKDWLLQGSGPMLAAGLGADSGAQAASSVALPVVKEQARAAIVATESISAPSIATTSTLPAAELFVASVPATAEPQDPTPPVLPAVPAEPVVAPVPVAPLSTAAAAVPPPVLPAAAPDTSWQTALYTQQMAHQLAMAELRNQHLQDQQRMMQQMLELMKQQMGK